MKAEIYSYRAAAGLFAGLSLEGAGLLVDRDANAAFYGVRSGASADVLALAASETAEVRGLKERLWRLGALLAPPTIILPPGSIVAPTTAPPVYVPAPYTDAAAGAARLRPAR